MCGYGKNFLNEKSVLNFKMDIFVNVKEGRRRFLKLVNFVVMLIAQAYFSNVYTKDIRIAMSKIKVLLKENRNSAK